MDGILALYAKQKALAEQIVWHDDDHFTQPDWIAGADVGFEQQGKVTRAAIAVLSFPALELVEYKIARIDTLLPYIPGLLSFRECPALLAAWHQLKQRPQLLFVDGHGVSHPRHLGVASHFGLLADIPTIGIAKKRLFGEFMPLDEHLNAKQPLYDQQRQLGWVLRSKVRCKPLFISIGHRIGMQSALKWTLCCMKGYRLTEPTRWADAIASRRPLFERWLTAATIKNGNV